MERPNITLEVSDWDPQKVVETLDGIPGAYERAQLGLSEVTAGSTVTLDEL